MLRADPDISEDEWVSFLQKSLSSEVTGKLTREKLIQKGKDYKNRSLGYKMVFMELFGEWDPDRKAWGEKGIITVLHSLGAKFEKFVERETEERMYKPKEKKNGND